MPSSDLSCFALVPNSAFEPFDARAKHPVVPEPAAYGATLGLVLGLLALGRYLRRRVPIGPDLN